ncbi:MAG: hypothetical protein Q8P18_29715 [Pseudomonadota bacterium]|nr:hypothetical protein [Pseudomonadota bacterium]
MNAVHMASVAAAILIVGVAGLQVALALGAPLGAYAWGGRAVGVLPGRLRAGSALSALVLLALAALVLLRAGWVTPHPPTPVVWAVRIIVGLLALNTLGNVVSASPSERRVMAPITLALTALVGFVAIRGP